MCLAIASGVVLTGVLSTWDDYTVFFGAVAPTNVARYGVNPSNISLLGVTAPLFTENAWVRPVVPLPATASALYVVSSVVLLSLVFFSVTRKGLEAGFSMTILAMLLTTPTVWVHNLTLAVVPVAVAYRSAAARWQRSLFFCSFAFLLQPGHLPFDVAAALYGPEKVPGALYPFLKVQTLGLAGLLLLLGTASDRQWPEGESPGSASRRKPRSMGLSTTRPRVA